MFRTIAHAYRAAFSGLPGPVWRLAVVAFINRSGTMVVPFLILYLTGQLGYTTPQAGGFITLYALGSLVGMYLGGWLSDRIAPRRVQMGSLAMTGGIFLLLEHLTTTPALAVGLPVLGLVGESFRPANSTSLARWVPPGLRTRAFALRRLAINLGITFGPAVGGFLARVDYAWLFRIDGATCLVAAVALGTWLPDEPPEETAPESAGERGAEKDADGDGTAEAGGESPSHRVSPSPWRDPPFLAFAGVMSLVGMVMFQFVSTYPLTLREVYRLTEDRIGLLISINTLIIVAFEMVLIHRLRTVSPLRVIPVGVFLLCSGFALLPLGDTFAFAALSVVVWTCGEMIAFPLAEAVAADRAPAGHTGRYLGLFATSFGISFALGQMVGPWVYGTWGPTVLWFGAGGLGVVLTTGLALLAPLLERRRHPASPNSS